jgi:three-Cys-motif partner protein
VGVTSGEENRKMSTEDFFEEQSDQSLVKATITAKYFDTWASIIVSAQKRNPKSGDRIAYIDLFAGPGRYKDGSSSTPIMILEKAIRNVDFRDRLVSVFNDKDEASVQSLEETIKKIQGIETLKYPPDILRNEVGEEIVKDFESRKFVPTLFYVDPWGYEGLSLRLINSVVKDWGCDAIFFFNYNRINMGISNPAVEPHMRALFEDQIDALVEKVSGLSSSTEREAQVIESLCQAIKGYGTRFTLSFRFKRQDGTRTSHHLVFVSKHFKGYDAMKTIMYGESTRHEDGVASFEYNPRDLLSVKQQLLFQLSAPLSELKDSLLRCYKGRSIGFIPLYEKHSIDTPFIKKNYKDVLNEMYVKSIIDAVGEGGKTPKKDTFADHMVITFPP